MTDRIVIITAGRDLTDPAPIWAFLDEQLEIAKRCLSWLVVYEGHCETGGDLFARQWVAKKKAEGESVDGRSFPPNPKYPSPARFHIRNREMVTEGAKRRDEADCAVIAGAFPGEGNGTKETIKLLAKARIETVVREGCS